MGKRKKIAVILGVVVLGVVLYFGANKLNIFADISGNAVIQTKDGLKLKFASGSLNALEIDKNNISLLSGSPLTITDKTNKSSDQKLTLSNLQTFSNSTQVKQTANAGSFSLTSKIDSKPNYLSYNIRIDKKDAADHPVNLCYGLPFDATGWSWSDDIQNSRKIDEVKVYSNYVSSMAISHFDYTLPINLYAQNPVASDKAGLSFAVPQDNPRSFYINYDNTAKNYQICFDATISSKTENFKNFVDFNFILYKTDDPNSAFRSGLDKYYQIFKSSYAKPADPGSIYFASIIDQSKYSLADFDFKYELYGNQTESYYEQNNISPLQYSLPPAHDFRTTSFQAGEPCTDSVHPIKFVDDFVNSVLKNEVTPALKCEGIPRVSQNKTVATTIAKGESMTVLAWIKPEDVSGSRFIFSKGYSTKAGYYLRMIDGAFELRIQDTDGKIIGPIKTEAKISADGKWHLVGFVYDVGKTSLIVDGAVAATGDGGLAAIDPGDKMHAFQIGYYAENTEAKNYFKGGIDEVKVWKKALNENNLAEEKNGYTGNSSGTCKGYCGDVGIHYNYNDGTASDVTGNGNIGLIQYTNQIDGVFGKAISFDGTKSYSMVIDPDIYYNNKFCRKIQDQGSYLGCSKTSDLNRKLYFAKQMDYEPDGLSAKSTFCNASTNGSNGMIAKYYNLPYGSLKSCGGSGYCSSANDYFPYTSMLNPSPYIPAPNITACQGVKNWGQTLIESFKKVTAQNNKSVFLDLYGVNGNENSNSRMFGSVKSPLVYDLVTRQPIIYEMFSYYEYASYLRQTLGQNALITGNAVGFPAGAYLGSIISTGQGEYYGSVATSATLDSINLIKDNGVDKTLTFQRDQLSDKPYTLEVHTYDPEKVKEIINHAAFYGFYAYLGISSVDNKTLYFKTDHDPAEIAYYKKVNQTVHTLNSAGWRPQTFAKSSDNAVKVERFGPKDGKIYFTVRNFSQEKKDANITIDFNSLAIKPQSQARDLLTGQTYNLPNNALKLSFDPKVTLIFELTADPIVNTAPVTPTPTITPSTQTPNPNRTPTITPNPNRTPTVTPNPNRTPTATPKKTVTAKPKKTNTPTSGNVKCSCRLQMFHRCFLYR